MPKSKRKGGKYYLDKGLLAITGDFTSYGDFMRTRSLSEEDARKALKYLLKMEDTRLRKGDSGRQYSLKRTKEISNMAPSGISDEQEKQIREAYDYVMTGEPVARLTGQEFQKDGTPLTEKVTRFYQERYNGKAVHPELGEVKLDLEG